MYKRNRSTFPSILLPARNVFDGGMLTPSNQCDVDRFKTEKAINMQAVDLTQRSETDKDLHAEDSVCMAQLNDLEKPHTSKLKNKLLPGRSNVKTLSNKTDEQRDMHEWQLRQMSAEKEKG